MFVFQIKKNYLILFHIYNKIVPEIINNSSKKILDIKNKYNLTNKVNVLNIDINKIIIYLFKKVRYSHSYFT